MLVLFQQGLAVNGMDRLKAEESSMDEKRTANGWCLNRLGKLSYQK